MQVATFNINGIKARINAFPEWLREASPDVVVLQEIKSIDEILVAPVTSALEKELIKDGLDGWVRFCASMNL